MKALAARRGLLFYIKLWFSLYKNTMSRALEYRSNFLGRAFTEIAWISSCLLYTSDAADE